MAEQTIAELKEELSKAEKELQEAKDELVTALKEDRVSDADKSRIQAWEKTSTADTGQRIDNNVVIPVSEDEEDSFCPLLQPSVNINTLTDEDFILIRKNNNYDPYDRFVPGAKLYISAQCSQLVFLNPINLTDCRAIVESPGIEVMSISNSYTADPSLTVIANVAEEDLAILANLGIVKQAKKEADDAEEREPKEKGKSKKNQNRYEYSEEEMQEFRFYIDYLEQYRLPVISQDFIVVKGASSNQATKHDVIKPRMATPLFAGIPIKSNNRVYGPWANDPSIMLNPNISDNLFGNIKVEQNSDYVPWKYGGIRFLENVVNFNIAYDVNYQSVLENGRVSIVGPPIFGIGGSFNPNILGVNRNSTFDNTLYGISSKNSIFYDANLNSTLRYTSIVVNSSNDYGFPVISNISIQTSNDGIKTSYSFQTYNPKTGLFNKELTDKARTLNNNISKINQQINTINKRLSNKALLERLDILAKARSSREAYKVDDRRTRFYGTSPVELIISQAQQHLDRVKFTDAWNITNNNGEQSLRYSDYASYGTDQNKAFYSGVYYSIRNHHWAGIITGDEIGSELFEDYSSKSAMSLDGILSPVSFYPTKQNGTYPLSTLVSGSGTFFGGEQNLKLSYNNFTYDLACPKCLNTRETLIYNLDGTELSTPLRIPCSVCSKAKLDIKKNDKDPTKKTSLPDVNLYSLNPIVVPSGEFRNPYALPDDICRHSIMAIGRGDNPQTNGNNFVLYNNIRKDNINKDYYRYDMDKQATDNVFILNNQRFMALRGPLMLHSWGFDTEGYPAPNAHDMPYHIDDNGLVLRFKLVDTTGDKNFGKNNLEAPGALLPSSSQYGITPLGDIITQAYTWSGSGTGIGEGTGKWTKKSTKSKYFYRNWAQKPDLWPVGPIDLRWDSQRRVWDASGGGCKEEILPPFIVTNKTDQASLQEFLANKTDNKCPYRNVYVTLESDMIKEDDYDSTYSTRAFIDDIEYNKEPLQNGYRRLVYVVDKTGYTAPKGTKLLCRYDRLSGFYEPLSKPSVMAIGTIGSGNSASVRLHHIQGRRSASVPLLVVNFDNPLELSASAGSKGIFIFINGKWTLSATKV